MNTSALKLLLLMSSFAPHANAGKFRDFCAKHIIAQDPDEAMELVRELKELYPGDRFHFFQALRSITISEMAKPEPNQRLLAAIDLEMENHEHRE